MILAPIYRLYQFALKIAANFLGIHEPRLVSGPDSIKQIPDVLVYRAYRHPLIVTDKSIYNLGLVNPLTKALEDKGLEFSVFYDVVANPTIGNVKEGLKIYEECGCDSIIAVGGGSAMDCAKVIGALANNKRKTVEKLKGLLHVHKRMPFFIAVPTTAGTGSETTIAAVIVNEETHHKYSINDPKLIPDFAFHDPKLLFDLPSKVTSTTGMDALTHAVEAYIGKSNTKKTKKAALDAIVLIKNNLYKSWAEGNNLRYRENMQQAAYLAGVAFTRAYVGYVHALAHAMGGKYNVAHGLANAILLPYVLEAFGKSCYKKLARITDELSLCDKKEKNEVKAKTFIRWIRNLNKAMEIPDKFDIKYNESDVDEMVRRAIKEANPLYPVPKILGKKAFREIYKKVLVK